MTFDQLSEANKERCEKLFHRVDAWSTIEWACAVAGETGEMCNLIKKAHRGDMIYIGDIADEAADIIIYLDLLCTQAGINLHDAIVKKFNKKSDQFESPIKLT